jgi:hypothetical protein
MLYEQWLEITAAFRARIGLRDLAVGNKWTFGEIAALIQQITPSKEKILFPQSGSAEFIFTVLRAWRDQQVICPLEEGQSAQFVDSEPPGILRPPQQQLALRVWWRFFRSNSGPTPITSCRRWA